MHYENHVWKYTRLSATAYSAFCPDSALCANSHNDMPVVYKEDAIIAKKIMVGIRKQDDCATPDKAVDRLCGQIDLPH